MKKKILVTCALPYSNGAIHLGHMLEHIQADIWVRYQRMIGNEVWFICSDDAHGTAIMLKSHKNDISSKVFIASIFQDHINDLRNFNISYDNYSSTHSIENLYLVNKCYYQLKLNNLIFLKKILQFYDTKKKMFLSDRFIQGTCPSCNANNQYGDTCEVCGAVYKPIKLINPISNISNTKPIIRSSIHIFFNLSFFQEMLYKWIHSGVLPKEVVNKVKEWFTKDLKAWNISRDAPYFGFKIPDMKNKYFYVWLDATIAYISTFKNLCDKNCSISFNEFWNLNSKTELYHFIGKDIVYFHALFWPAILESNQFRKPTKIFVHGHLKFRGMKFSKSKNVIITAKKWLKYLDSDSLRYYFASKLSSKVEDIEIDLKEFRNKINSDIVNKIVNLASRSSSFLNKYFDNLLSSQLENKKIYQYFVKQSDKISHFFNNRNFNFVIQTVVQLSDLANQYFNKKAPWKMVDQKNNLKLQEICSMGINLFRMIMIYLKPIVPDLAKKVELFLLTDLNWESIHAPLFNHYIAEFKSLYQRISIEKINQLI
ncbi:methionine--tRNA ligase [Buchnera aphidicola]|uniref:methionine--tRNA ligase n=1 Tax=Buchnera aphidicola TaxID=9 RepID=UPI003463B66F